MPKGKITLDDLSKLLLTYMSVIADILDTMKMVEFLARRVRSGCDVKMRENLFYASLIFLSLSLFQLSIGLTAKRQTKTKPKKIDMLVKFCISKHKKEKNSRSIECKKFREFCRNIHLIIWNHIVRSFEKEIWGIILSLLIKDIPFAILRTFSFVLSLCSKCDYWNQSIFFTLKNYLTIIIQVNRWYVIFNHNDDEAINDEKIENNFKSNLSQNSNRNSTTTSTSDLFTKYIKKSMSSLIQSKISSGQKNSLSQSKNELSDGRRKLNFWNKKNKIKSDDSISVVSDCNSLEAKSSFYKTSLVFF